MRHGDVEVLKLGGSLIDEPATPELLTALIRREHIARPLIIVGGGRAADLVRHWHEHWQLDEDAAHDLAVAAMSLNARLIATVVPRCQLVLERAQAERIWQQGGWPVLDCSRFLPCEESNHELTLPHTWLATSDAISSWITLVWPARRLVLLKSSDIPARAEDITSQLRTASACSLAERGLIDAQLAEWAHRLPALAWVNLRHAPGSLVDWIPTSDSPIP